MPGKRRRYRELVRVFDGMRQPVYLVDDSWRIRYCNASLLTWLGCAEDAILDRRCAYHSGAIDPGDALAAGLCPPPGAMEAAETLGEMACLTSEGKVERRAVRFLRLEAPGSHHVLLAIAESEDLCEMPPREGAAICSPRAAPPLPSPSVKLDERVALQLHRGLQEFRARREGRGLPAVLLGSSPAAMRLRSQFRAASRTDENVLFVGPEGVEMGAVAVALFDAWRSVPEQALIPIPCPELDADVLEDVLQAFQSAGGEKNRPDMLLLENVDRLPDDAQAMLRRWMGSPWFRMRIVATAQESLLHLAAKGRFNPELAGGISVLGVELPELKSRREDIPLLAQAVLEEWNAEGQKQVSGITRNALDVLSVYNWPGNLDELRRTVRLAHEKVATPLIDVTDLPRSLISAIRQQKESLARPTKVSLTAFLADVERELLRRALRRARGNKTLAAKILGLSRPRLYRRIVQLGLKEALEDERNVEQRDATNP